MTKEALKMALEALEIGYDAVYAEAQQYHYAMSGYRPNTHKRMDDDVQKIAKAITAIKEALAQQQEPVAWLHNGKLHEFDPSDWATGPVTPLYTSPPASKPWVGLTDEEMKKVWYAMQNIMGWYSFQEIARAIEAKLKEKNYG